jgi:hypothetical protein
MKVLIWIVITLILISVITIVLIKKSIKTQDTKIDLAKLAEGNLTVNIKMNLLLPFKVTISDLIIRVGAGSSDYFEAKIPTLELNPQINIIPVTFVPIKAITAVDLLALATQKKFVSVKGIVLGLEFSRTEEL